MSARPVGAAGRRSIAREKITNDDTMWLMERHFVAIASKLAPTGGDQLAARQAIHFTSGGVVKVW
ncbi:hypothetical protein J2Y88_003995 [Pseudomonas chlororaphis]|jgi:hypothetical protein|uniref:hypothetical protein n=1 Tax=Pseudomonas chlororaphis TaxID=587753 RepID=UPI0020A1A542|nr:hypothetical protein [Pseudomonas chlororaphis]MCP1481684.1 hypothetical protein [Pseudomonas chlororaphis]MCP1597957.1 hypothetical protein [Pseudomonas chlororaphis]